jgi:hypothetical protein
VEVRIIRAASSESGNPQTNVQRNNANFGIETLVTLVMQRRHPSIWFPQNAFGKMH